MFANETDAVMLRLNDASSEVSACAGAVAQALKAANVTAAAHIDWNGFDADIGDKIEKMLDINLVAPIVGAWKDLKAVRACADRTKHAPDETISLPLVDHDIEASLKPYLDITIGDLPVQHVQFEIACDIELHAAVAIIRDAAIVGLRLGGCRAGATVKCDHAKIFERKSRTLEVPGQIRLAKAVPIGTWGGPDATVDHVPGRSHAVAGM
jgi:hypothetical protein